MTEENNDNQIIIPEVMDCSKCGLEINNTNYSISIAHIDLTNANKKLFQKVRILNVEFYHNECYLTVLNKFWRK